MHTLFSPYHRSKKLHLRSLLLLHKEIHHLIHGLLLNLPSAHGTVGQSHPRIEKTHIVVDFRDCSHRGTWISVCRFLINGNRGRKSLYELHIRLFHLSEELSCIRRERLHIAPLPLCVNGIEGKRGLSGTRESRKHH